MKSAIPDQNISKSEYFRMATSLQYKDCLHALWEGHVTLNASIAETDASSADKNLLDSIFVCGSRISYLPVVLADSIEYFRQNAIEFSSDVWFEHENIPLQSNLPIGVLYDMYGGGIIPMRIMVHFQAFPVQKLLKCSTTMQCEQMYFHSLKQALFVLYGNTRVFNELSVEQQKKLWHSAQTGHLTDFEGVADALRPSVELFDSSSGSIQSFRGLPVRVVRKNKPTLQRHVVIFKPLKTETVSTSSKTADAAAAHPVVRTLLQVLSEDFGIATESSNRKCIIQGVNVPLHAPIYDMWRLMSYADLFLYIIILE